MITYSIHPEFRLDGKAYSIEQLCEWAREQQLSQLEFWKDLGQFILEWFDDKDYVLLTTSGTTGVPKQIKLQKEAMINSAKATGEFFDVGEETTALLCMSVRYIAGKLMLVRALVLGWKLDVVEASSTPLKNNEKEYDFVAMVPMQVEKSIEELYRIKKLIVGGAKVSNALAKKLKYAGHKTKIYETYGMTETITHIAAKELGETEFTVLPHAKVRIDQRGCLVIVAPSVNPEQIVTNDLVELRDSKHFIWLGRIDNVINSGGVKLFPEQIEEKLTQKIPYRFFVTAKEDEYLGNKLILVIESLPYDLPEDVYESLSKYEKPKEIQFVEKFTETATGKIIRRKNIV